MTMVEQQTCNTYAKKIPFFHKYRAKLKTKKLFGLFMMLGFFWEYWMWDTPSPTQPKMVSHMLHSLDISSMDSLHRYCWSKDPAFWLDKRHNWSHPPKVVASDILLSLDDNLQAKNLRYQLIPSRDIVDKRISQSHGTRGKTCQPNHKC